MKILQAQYIQNEITALLLAHPELAEDEVLRADSIEGETGAFEFLSMIGDLIDDAVDVAEGTNARIIKLESREARLGRRINALRGLIMRIMNTADLRKAELPGRTFSVRSGPQRVLIINDGEIPEEYVRVKVTREPDRTKIKAAITAGYIVPGCALSNAEPSLAILVK